MPADSSAARLLLHNARREALIVLAAWLLSLIWTVGYCYLYGYQHAETDWVVQAGWATVRGDDIRLIAGLPDWIAIGIMAPWAACTIFTVIFGLFIMQDDDLGAEASATGDGHAA